MNTKRIFALVSAFTIAFAGVPAHAVFAEEAPSVDEAVVVEETVEEAAEEVVADEVVTPVVEKTVETEEETAADDDVLVEDETKATEDVVAEDEEAESEVLTEDEEAEIEAELEEELEETLEEEELEEEHEHEFIYISVGEHQHKKVCTADDCDITEEIIEDCVDENDDKVCDLCGEKLEPTEFQKTSGITVEIHSWTPFLDGDGEVYVDLEGNVLGVYMSSIANHYEVEDRIVIADMINAFNESDEYFNMTTEFSNLDGIDAVYNDLLAIGEELPSDTYVVITERDGVIESYSVEFEDNYDPNFNKDDAAKVVEEEALEAEDVDADAEDKEAEELIDDTEIVAKEDEILPEDVVVDEAEIVESTEQTEELVEEIVVDEAPVDETPAANDSAAEEIVTNSAVDGE